MQVLNPAMERGHVSRNRSRRHCLQDLIDRRNDLFVSHSRSVIEGEIVFHRRNMIFQIVGGLIWSLIILSVIYQMYLTGFRYFNIWLALPTILFVFYGYTVLIDVKGHLFERRLWEKALVTLNSKDEGDDAFETCLDFIPRELKHTAAYKSMRRKHFELSCNMESVG